MSCISSGISRSATWQRTGKAMALAASARVGHAAGLHVGSKVQRGVRACLQCYAL